MDDFLFHLLINVLKIELFKIPNLCIGSFVNNLFIISIDS